MADCSAESLDDLKAVSMDVLMAEYSVELKVGLMGGRKAVLMGVWMDEHLENLMVVWLVELLVGAKVD